MAKRIKQLDEAPIDVFEAIKRARMKLGDALKMQHLLQGYIIAHQREVDCNSMDKEQLVVLLTDLGQGVSD